MEVGILFIPYTYQNHLIVLMTWTSFWMKPEALSVKLTLGVKSLNDNIFHVGRLDKYGTTAWICESS